MCYLKTISMIDDYRPLYVYVNSPLKDNIYIQQSVLILSMSTLYLKL